MSLAQINENLRLYERLKVEVPKVEEKLRPTVVRIRFSVDEDWVGDPALHFRVILADEAIRGVELGTVTRAVEDKIEKELRLRELDRWSYFNFRIISEQERLKDPDWD